MANTPFLNLNLPAWRDTRWDVTTNENWNTVDTAISGVSGLIPTTYSTTFEASGYGASGLDVGCSGLINHGLGTMNLIVDVTKNYIPASGDWIDGDSTFHYSVPSGDTENIFWQNMAASGMQYKVNMIALP